MLGHAIGLAILSARMVTCQSASWQKTTQNDETASGSDRIRHVVFTDLITSSNLPNYAKDIKTYRTWIELVMGLCHSAAWYSVRPHAQDEIAALLEKPLNVDPQVPNRITMHNLGTLITNLATSGHPCIWVISSKSSWSHSCTHAWCLSNLKSQIFRFHCCTATFDIVLCLHILLADSQLLLVHHSDWNLIRHTFHYLPVWRGQKHVKIVWSASLPTHQVTCEVSDDPMQFKEKHPTYKLILSNIIFISIIESYITLYISLSYVLILSHYLIITDYYEYEEILRAKYCQTNRTRAPKRRCSSVMISLPGTTHAHGAEVMRPCAANQVGSTGCFL